MSTTIKTITARLQAHTILAADNPLAREYDKLHKHFTDKAGRAKERGTGYPSRAFWEFKVPNPSNSDAAPLLVKLYLKGADSTEEVDERPSGKHLLKITLYARRPMDGKWAVKADTGGQKNATAALAALKVGITRANRDPWITDPLKKFLGL